MRADSDHDTLATETVTRSLDASQYSNAATYVDDAVIEPASSIGRFSVLRRVGAGGMGVVYAAYDPRLDRCVALKLLRTGSDPLERQRLVREAQALARLNHPNVVAVHDVGTHDGQLFVAMEFVEGINLHEWLLLHPPGTPSRLEQALELLLQAGRGLEAAHRAGLVHRDVKPKNILLGVDGRTRIADFGLARSDIDATSDELRMPARADETLEEGATLLERPLTQTGKVNGTPAYMAPEQFCAQTVGPATDQFAYCVAAWEVLFGTRPFSCEQLGQLFDDVRNHVLARPVEVEVPPAIEAALRKGLAYAPSRRHASMSPILTALRDALDASRHARRRKRSTRRLWGFSTALVLTTSTAAFFAGRSELPMCEGAQRHFEGLWDASRKAELEATILATNLEFAADAWQRIEHGVDDWRERWVAAHRETCEATNLRGELSAEVLDLRMACLASHRAELAALLEVFGQARVETLARSDDALSELSPVSRCENLDDLRARGAVPRDAENPGAVTAVLIRASALLDAADYEGALALARASARDADALGLPGRVAEARMIAGKVLLLMHRVTEAVSELEQAYMLARRTNLADVAIDAGLKLSEAFGSHLAKFERGHFWAKLARVEAERIADEAKLAQIEVVEGGIYLFEGRMAQAQEVVEQAVERYASGRVDDDADHARALTELSSILIKRRAPERAMRAVDEAVRLMTGSRGSRHPAMSYVRTLRAVVLDAMGRRDEALDELDQAIEIAASIFGNDHTALFDALSIKANVLFDRARHEEAAKAAEWALNLRRPEPLDGVRRGEALERLAAYGHRHDPKTYVELLREAHASTLAAVGPQSPHTVKRGLSYALALANAGMHERSAEVVDEVLAAAPQVLHGESPILMEIHHDLGVHFRRRGQSKRALEHQRQALRVAQSVYGSASSKVVAPHLDLCETLGSFARHEDALAHCDEALQVLNELGLDEPYMRIVIHASALWMLAEVGRFDEAERHHENIIGIWDHHPQLGRPYEDLTLRKLGRLRERQGRLAEAGELYERALSSMETRVGPEDPSLVGVLLSLGELALLQGERQRALAQVDRALAIADAGFVDEPTRLRLDALRVKALWLSPRTRRLARRLAPDISKQFEALGEDAAPAAEDFARWVRSH